MGDRYASFCIHTANAIFGRSGVSGDGYLCTPEYMDRCPCLRCRGAVPREFVGEKSAKEEKSNGKLYLSNDFHEHIQYSRGAEPKQLL